MNEFNSQICTSVEQSKRLLELGLKPETADMAWVCVTKEGLTQWVMTLNTPKNKPNIDTPAWSLHSLLCLYGQDYTIKELYNNAEECYGMLISAIGIAIENNEFNKEYLKP